MVKMSKVDSKAGYFMVMPYLIYFAAFIAYPLIFSFILIFHRWNIVTPMEFIGLKNFVRLFKDELFFKSIINTLIFLSIHIPLQIVIALFLQIFSTSK
jgi:multiple sugar transport system permease protein